MRGLIWACAVWAAGTACAAEPGEVRIGGALGARFDLTLSNNVFRLDHEKDFYAPFRKKASGPGLFVGYGKHADALVHFAKNSDDPRVAKLKDGLIGFIIDRQLPDGYTGCMRPESRMVAPWDMHDMGFIIQALVADYAYFGNGKALEAARRNADYMIANWDRLPDDWATSYVTDRMLTLGFTYGLERLFELTGERKYLDFVLRERSLGVWNLPVVIGRGPMVYGHSYVYLSTCFEQLELYRLHQRQQRYLKTSLGLLDFMVRGDGLLIDGTGGVCECWTDDQDGEGSIGETCTVAYQLIFYDQLMRLGLADPALLGDLSERAIYNALFGAQSRDGRKIRYYTPLNGRRKFWGPDTYCCPNNFRRAVSRLPEYVFYADEDGILANLYTDCRAELSAHGVKVGIREETAYPADGRIVLTLTPERPIAFTLKLRIPSWCAKASAHVNGKPVTYRFGPGEMLALPRTWKAGDRVELELPMEVRTILGRQRQAGRFAVMRGPVAYSLVLDSLKAFKGRDPLDAATALMMDPLSLRYENGCIKARVTTNDSAVGVSGARSTEAVLVPFSDEDVTLTYFRAPDLKRTVTAHDELLGGQVNCGL